jgi:hypothetical protein
VLPYFLDSSPISNTVKNQVMFFSHGMKKVMMLKMATFLDVAPCSLVDIDQCFKGPYYLSHL